MAFLRSVPATIVGLMLVSVDPATAQDDWMVKASPHSVPDTVARLTTAIEGAGAKVAAVVDHSAAAQAAGMELPPTTVVIFGNPKIGTPLMMESRQIGIDLPLRVLVWQDGDSTRVGYLAPAALAERYGIDAGHQSIEMMSGALDKLTNAAVAE